MLSCLTSLFRPLKELSLSVETARQICQGCRPYATGYNQSTGDPVTFLCSPFQRPVRCVLDRKSDMLITGGRHPMTGKYRIGAKKDGTLVALEIKMLANCGFTKDLSVEVLTISLLEMTGPYRIPNTRFVSHMCKTNIRSSTAFRGFGSPQSHFVLDTAVRHLVGELGMSPEEVMFQNLRKENDLHIDGQTVKNYDLVGCWTDLIKSSAYWERKNSVNTFNQEHKTKKRGIALTATSRRHGDIRTSSAQGSAVVNIQLDGSVFISHGGVDMGQGINTHVMQVASRVLDISMSKIHIKEVSTDVVPHPTVTACSTSSQLFCPAVKDACEQLLSRLKPFIDNRPDGVWSDWVQAAFENRVLLSAIGHYRREDIYHDFETGFGTTSDYFTFGAGCSEVEVDCLTGNFKVLRTDVVLDVGRSLNPAIDIGQIEGGFVQAMGLYMIENESYRPNGELVSAGLSTYRVPTLSDTPVEFNVTLRKDRENPKAIYSSKAVAEPAMSLGASIFFAAKMAVSAAREDCGLTGHFPLNAPATPDKLKLACSDMFVQQATESMRHKDNTKADFGVWTL